MSFGYAVGDFVLLTQLAWGVVQNSRKACGAHDELTSEVTSLHMVLRRLEVEVSKPGSILTRSDNSLDRKEELAQISGDCRRVLRVLDKILEKYNALSEEKRRVTKLWKKVQFGNGEMLDLAEIRLKILTSTSALTLFLNLLSIGSQGKVESYMESQGEELREIRRSLNWVVASNEAKVREGSILTSYAGDDKAIWKAFRRELIQEGFSSEVIQRHMKTIKEYVMELGSRGALDDVADMKDGFSCLNVVGGSESSDFVEHINRKGSIDESQSGSEERTRQKLRKRAEEHPEDGMEKDGNGDTEEYCSSKHYYSGVKTCEELLSETVSQSQETGGTQVDAIAIKRHVSRFLRVPTKPNEPVIAEVRDVSPAHIAAAHASGEAPEGLGGILRLWFGPYYSQWTCRKLWELLQFKAEYSLFPAPTQVGGVSRTYNPHSLCDWMLSSALIYDETQPSTSSSPNPSTLLSPTVNEFRLLILRACTYNARIRMSSRQFDAAHPFHDFADDFREFVAAFYYFIRDGIRYTIALSKERGYRVSSYALWTVDEQLVWDQEKDEFVAKHAALNEQWIGSLYDLGRQASVDFVCGLFENKEIVRWECGCFFVEKSLAGDFTARIQALLLFFKTYCEDILLLEESSRPEHVTPLLHHIHEHELRDRAVERAIRKLQASKDALYNWSLDEGYVILNFKIPPTSRNTAMLHVLLELHDEAQNRVYMSRKRAVQRKSRMITNRKMDSMKRSKHG